MDTQRNRNDDGITEVGDDEATQPLQDGDATVEESEIPPEDQPPSERQPESQGADPFVAEVGDEGEGDLSPGDL